MPSPLALGDLPVRRKPGHIAVADDLEGIKEGEGGEGGERGGPPQALECGCLVAALCTFAAASSRETPCYPLCMAHSRCSLTHPLASQPSAGTALPCPSFSSRLKSLFPAPHGFPRPSLAGLPTFPLFIFLRPL